MKLLETSVYLGPSLYAHFPVIRLGVDLGELERWPTMKLGRAFNDALLAALPGLHEHGCSYETPGGLVRRLTEGEGTWLGHVLEHTAIELQNVAGAHVTFGRTRAAGEPAHYHVVYQYEQAEVGLEAGRLALALLHSLLPEPLRPADVVPADFDFAAQRDEFIRFAQRRALGPSTASLVRAAEERDIPWLRLNHHSLIQFGHGKYQKRIQATITSQTHHIAVEIASDKEETNRILGDLGLPVPQQRLVTTEEEAAKEAVKLGFPLVVKPYNGNHGRGVSLDLGDAGAVREAFHKAREVSRAVVVEQFVTGRDYRMLVVNGQLIAVAERVPGHVVGDGIHTVEQLVEITNQDPRRGIGHEKVLTRLELDHQAERCLRERGYARHAVPPEGEAVRLRLTGNLSTGGTAIDVTDVVHPDNTEMAVRAIPHGRRPQRLPPEPCLSRAGPPGPRLPGRNEPDRVRSVPGIARRRRAGPRQPDRGDARGRPVPWEFPAARIVLRLPRPAPGRGSGRCRARRRLLAGRRDAAGELGTSARLVPARRRYDEREIETLREAFAAPVR